MWGPYIGATAAHHVSIQSVFGPVWTWMTPEAKFMDQVEGLPVNFSFSFRFYIEDHIYNHFLTT